MSEELTFDAAVERIGQLVRDVDKLNLNWKNELGRRVDVEAERDALASVVTRQRSEIDTLRAENARSFDEFCRQLSSWADAEFPQSTSQSVAIHMQREGKELAQAPFGVAIAIEGVDVAMLLIHLAHKQGANVMDWLWEKFEEVQERDWEPPDAQGVAHHKRGE